METFFMNTKNSKTNESHRFKYDLIDKLDLKNPNKSQPRPQSNLKKIALASHDFAGNFYPI